MFYTFSQNNSGGDFYSDENLATFVVIEATSQEGAKAKAESIGIYFNGVTFGVDCPCCGDRWDEPEDPTENPEIWGKSLDQVKIFDLWTDPFAVVHYRDGKKVIFRKNGAVK